MASMDRPSCSARVGGRAVSQRGFSFIEVLAAVAVMAIVAGVTVPMAMGTLDAFQFQGDGQGLVGLTNLARTRAAASFSRSRVFADLAADTYRLEIWDKAGGAWVTEGGVRQLSSEGSFGFGGLAAPPPNTQVAIAQSAPCTDNLGANIPNTACIVFNSRGVPIDGAGVPIGGNAIYATNGIGVYGVTVTAAPLVRLWWSPASNAAWVQQ